MIWKTRICGENLYHHVYAWGNDRHPVFKDVCHYRKYLEFLKKHAREHEIDVLAYALMQWHVHLFIYDYINNISLFMQNLHGDYAQYFNRETHRVGHVFGERFNNKVVQINEYGIWLSRYIHRQPLEAGLVDEPKDYPWTSYRRYLGLEKKDFIKNDLIIRQFGEEKDAIKNYEDFVLGGDDGPINWGDRKINMALVSVILNKAVTEFGVSKRVLLEPRGTTERRKRRLVIAELHKKYGYKINALAKAFQISHVAVIKILRSCGLGIGGRGLTL